LIDRLRLAFERSIKETDMGPTATIPPQATIRSAAADAGSGAWLPPERAWAAPSAAWLAPTDATRDSAPRRASDADREQTVGLLREHCQVGRLTLAELEDRAQEAMSATYVAELWEAMRELPVPLPGEKLPAAETSKGQAVVSLVLGIVGLCVLAVSFSMACALSLPLSAAAWKTGRRARHRSAAAGGAPRGNAVAGEVLGAVGTGLSALALVVWIVALAAA